MRIETEMKLDYKDVLIRPNSSLKQLSKRTTFVRVTQQVNNFYS